MDSTWRVILVGFSAQLLGIGLLLTPRMFDDEVALIPMIIGFACVLGGALVQDPKGAKR